MNEKFSTLFLDSIKDGSYTIGLKNKISELRRLVHDAQENKIDELRFSSHQDESQSETIRQNPTELTNNFLTDSNISQSYKNPSYYPPVPKYKIPKGKRYTNTQIAQIKMTRDIDFIENNIIVGKVPLSSEDIGNEFIGLSHMNSSILTRSIIYEESIDITTGYVRTPNYVYPEITNCVGYMVNTYLHPSTHKQYLSHMYAYKNKKTIILILDFLKTLEVENMNDLENSKEFFTHILLNK